jgi:Flp pilus assembly protein TadG
MKIFRNDEGQMLVFTALSMTILFGFLAISVEVGLFFRQKRYLQTAADAAATAAALDYYYNYASQGANAISHAQTEGKTAATANGFTDGVNGTSITISCSPQYGPEHSTSCNGFFEAIITKTSASPFMSTFSDMSSSTANLKSFKVGARAVAGTPSPSNNCIWLMDDKMSGELNMTGSKSTLNAPGCGVYLNSSSTSAVKFNGNPNVTVQSLNLLSSQDLTKGTNNFIGQFNNNVVPQSPPIDPNFAGAGTGDCTTTYTGSSTLSTSYTPPGAGSPSATTPVVVCFTQAMTISGGTATSPIVLAGMSPTTSGYSAGVIYEFQQGLTINTGAYVNFGSATYTPPGTGQNVGTYTNTYGATIDMQGGAFNILSGQAYLSAYAPTSGAYNGIALMQPSGNNSQSTKDNNCSDSSGCLSVQFGSAGTNFDGMIFAPNAQVVMHDAGAGVTASGLVADQITMATSNLTIDNYSQANPYTTPLRMVQLTE